MRRTALFLGMLSMVLISCTQTNQSAERALRVFNVGGIEVVAVTESTELPERATQVVFESTIIDAGSGPVLCGRAVDASLPPQCSGLFIDGIEMTGWSEQSFGVIWGERSVTVSWPPVDRRVDLITDGPHTNTEVVFPHLETPEVCQGITDFVSPGTVTDYARQLGSESGGLYVTSDGRLVLQVTSDPAPHRIALASDGMEACVVQTKYSEAELTSIRAQLEPQLRSIAPEVASSASGIAGRVELRIDVADLATVNAIADLVEDPASVRVIGRAVLLPD